MRPLTDHRPKPLLQAGKHALIEHQLLALAGAGFERAVINVHYLADMMEAHLGDGRRYGIEIVFSREETLLGTAGGIRKALPLLGEKPFAVVNADIFTDFDYASLPRELAGCLGHLVMVDNPPWHPEGDFGLDAAGRLTHGPDKLTYGCISVYDPALFGGRETGPQPMRELYDPAIDKGLLGGEYFRGVWHNVGTPAQLAAVNSMLE